MRIKNKFRERLIKYREEAGLTRKELAHLVGIRPEIVTAYENYSHKCPKMLYRYYELAKALKIPMSHLVTNDEMEEFSFASKLNYYRQSKCITVNEFCRKTGITDIQLKMYESFRAPKEITISDDIVEKFARVLGIPAYKLQPQYDVEIDKMTQGEIIRYHRIRLGFKQIDVARLTGFSKQLLVELENDHIHEYDHMKVLRVVEVLKIPPHYIFSDRSIYDKENWKFSQRLKYYRVSMGYSQDELVENAHYICNSLAISDFEVRGIIPHINIIAILASAIGIPVHYLSDAPDVGYNLFSVMKI